jgi:CRP-like cAMP-binding protein
MSHKTDVLNKVDAFKSLDDTARDKIAEMLEPRVVHEGEELAEKGHQAFSFFILISGSIMLYREDKKAVVFNKPGAFLGFKLLVKDDRYNATLKSLTKGEVLVLDHSKFLEMINQDLSMAESIKNEWESYLQETAPFIKAESI